MLDFAGDVLDVLSPLPHSRTADRIEPCDEDAFAATAEVALLLGWAYRVVTGGEPTAVVSVNAFSAQRRPLSDQHEPDTCAHSSKRSPNPCANGPA